MVKPNKSLIERGASKPRSLPVDPDGIPAVLKALPQWVCWRYVRRADARGNSKWSKLPLDPRTGQNAKANDPATWTTFAAALDYYRTHRSDVDGIGFVFAADDPFTGVDLDNARDVQTGQLAAWAARVVAILDSYTEISPSGSGVKIFVAARAPGEGHKKPFPGAPAGGRIEIYSERRYYAVTGRFVDGCPATVNERQAALDELYAEIWRDDANSAEGSAKHPSRNAQACDDGDALLSRALKAQGSDKLRALWQGDTSGYPSQSEADLALCGLLAFWTGPDPERIDRLFRRSGLYRDKWEQRTKSPGSCCGCASD